MKKVEAVIKHFRLDDVKKALTDGVSRGGESYGSEGVRTSERAC